MTTTAALVESSPNRLRYLITHDGQAGLPAFIRSSGGATPDLLTDSLQGTLKKLAKAFADGYAGFAAGAKTLAQARALWLSDWAGADPAPGDPVGAISLVTTAICKITPRTGANSWIVDMDVTVVAGVPSISIAATAAGVAATAYLDVIVPEAIG